MFFQVSMKNTFTFFSFFILAHFYNSKAYIVQSDPLLSAHDFRDDSKLTALKQELEQTSDLDYLSQNPTLTLSEIKNDRLLAYLYSHGVKKIYSPDNKIAISQFSLEDEDEKGMIAVKDIEKGEEVITIPFSAGLVLDPSDPSPYPNATWEIRLAAKLLRERALGKQSPYHDFLSFLPHSLPLLPWLYLSPTEFKEVQYEPTVRRMADLLFETSEAFERSDSSVMNNATWADFTWAMAMVWTHSVSLQAPVSEGSNELEWRYMFLPIIDLLYHNHEANVDWRGYGVHADRVQLSSIQPIKQGQLLFLDHGVYTTEAMFMYYGYVTKDNPMDYTIIFYSLEDAVYWYLQRYHPAFNSKENESRETTKKSKTQIQKTIDEFVEIAKMGALKGMQYYKGIKNGHQFLEITYLDPHDDTHGLSISVNADGRVDVRVLAAFAAVQHEIDGVHESFDHLRNQTQPLDRADAVLDLLDDLDWEMDVEDAYPAVRRRCAELLMSYPTTVREDRTMLRKGMGRVCDEEEKVCDWSGGLTPALELAVKYRLVKKLTLEKFMVLHPGEGAKRKEKFSKAKGRPTK